LKTERYSFISSDSVFQGLWILSYLFEH